MFFVDQVAYRIAEYRRRRREHQALHVMAPHHFQQVESARNIVAVVGIGVTHGFADQRERAKMHYRIEVTSQENPVERTWVQQIRFDQLTPAHGLTMASGQVVQNSDPMSV